MSSQSSQPEQGKRPQLRAIPERRRSDRTQTSGTAALAGDAAEISGSATFDAEAGRAAEATVQLPVADRRTPSPVRPVVPPPAASATRPVAPYKMSIFDRLPHVSLMAIVLIAHVIGVICAVVFLL